MNEGPRQKPPPLPKDRMMKLPAPKAEAPVGDALLQRLRSLLPNASISEGKVLQNGREVGICEKGRILIAEAGSGIRLPIPPSIANLAKSKGMAVFFEITEDSVLVCAGKTLGDKVLSLRVK